MGACGCFSGGQTTTLPESTVPQAESWQQDAFPQPPPIFREQDSKYISSRLSEAISPVEAERSLATINRRNRNSADFDKDRGPIGSSHALLSQKSGGFERTTSLQVGTRESNEVRRSISERGKEITGNSMAHQVWSPSRKELEMAIHAEKAKDHADWNPDLQSEEQRLTKRLGKLNLEMKVMVGDGNCQFRAVSYGLYGTQDYHRSVRQKAVEFMSGHKEKYEAFLGENVDEYLASMDQPGTWGDELTLRAISDYWGIIINVVTSDQHNWFMRYKPPRIKLLLECFVTYIAPCHYNAIRRQTVTSALRSNLSRQTSSTIQQAMKRAISAERSLASTQLEPHIQAALRSGQKMDAPSTATTGAPAPESAAKTTAAASAAARSREHTRRHTLDQMMSPVEEGASEGRVSGNSQLSGSSPHKGVAVPPSDFYHGSGSRLAHQQSASGAGGTEIQMIPEGIDRSPMEAQPVQPRGVAASAFAALSAQQPLAAKQMEMALDNGVAGRHMPSPQMVSPSLI